jgi:uncharacterized protein
MGMSDTRETVEGLYAALGAGDMPTATGLMAEDVEWKEADGFPLAGTYRGPQGVVDGVFAGLMRTFDDFRADVDRIVVDGDHAVAVGTYSAKGKSTGKSFSARFAHALEVRGGKVARFEQIVDSAQVNQAL